MKKIRTAIIIGLLCLSMLSVVSPRVKAEVHVSGDPVYGVGTYFGITDSPYLNITLASAEVVRVILQSAPEMVSLIIESNCSATLTTLTFEGFEANKTYYRFQDGYSVEDLVSDLDGTCSYSQDLSEAHHIVIQGEQSTIYINSDGTVTPSTAPITVINNVYTFSANIYETIRVYKDSIIIDGNGYTLQGWGSYFGIDLSGRFNVTVRNVNANRWAIGFLLSNSHHLRISDNSVSDIAGAGIQLQLYSDSNNITGNVATRCGYGIGLGWDCDFNILEGNSLLNNRVAGVRMWYSCDENKFFHDNFIGNYMEVDIQYGCSGNLWDDSYPSGGNYWGYGTSDVNCGPGQDQLGKDDICDTPYTIDWRNRDYYPLMNAWTSDSSERSVIIHRAGQSYPALLVSGSPITKIQPAENKLRLTLIGTSGTSGYLRMMLPVGLFTTSLSVFINGIRAYPTIVTDGIQYFVYLPFNFASEVEVDIFFAPITATVDIDPYSLNVGSSGQWITCHIELPEEYSVANIYRATVQLNGTIAIDPEWIDKPLETVVGDYDKDGVPDLIVKFDRAKVSSYILSSIDTKPRFAFVTLTVTGELIDGTPFKGSDTHKVILPTVRQL